MRRNPLAPAPGPATCRASAWRRVSAGLALAAALLAPAPELRAANDVFLRIAGITGESTAPGHVGDIGLQSFAWGMMNSAIFNGTTGSVGVGKANAQDVSITKRIDQASPALVPAVFAGQHFNTVTLFVRNKGTNPLDFLKLTLSDVVVTSYRLANTADSDNPTELISLGFSKIRIDYIPQKPDGTSAGATATVTWDVAQNTAS